MDRTGFVWGDEYVKLPGTDRPWVVEPILPVGGWANLFGKPKYAKKSWFALTLAWALATHQPDFLGYPIRAWGPTLFLQADTPRGQWALRVKAFMKGGYDVSRVAMADLQTLPMGFDVIEHRDMLAEYVADISNDALERFGEPPVQVVLDTSRELHFGDENHSQTMKAVMSAVQMACPDLLKLLVSHDKKGGAADYEEGDERHVHITEGARGSTGVTGKMDTIMKLTPKGYWEFVGRGVDPTREKLNFRTWGHGNDRAGVWERGEEAEAEAAKKALLSSSKPMRQIARELAKEFGIEEERARGIVRRERNGLARNGQIVITDQTVDSD